MHESSDDDEEAQTLYPTKDKYIINAITGVQTPFRVGSKYERNFWKVINASLAAYDPEEKSGRTYFFPSPEAYENAKDIKLSKVAKLSWENRRNGAKCDCLSVHVCNPKISPPPVTA